MTLPYKFPLNEAGLTYINGIAIQFSLDHADDSGLSIYAKPKVSPALYPVTARLRFTLLHASKAPSKLTYSMEHEFHSDGEQWGGVIAEKGKAIPVVNGTLTMRVRVESIEYNSCFVLGVAHAALCGNDTLIRSLAAAQAELLLLRSQHEKAVEEAEQAKSALAIAQTLTAPSGAPVSAGAAASASASASASGGASAKVIDLVGSPKRQKLGEAVEDHEKRLREIIERRNPDELRRELTATELVAHRLRAAIDEADKCAVCMAAKREVMFRPCNHMVCCEACSLSLCGSKCCVCRVAITGFVVPKAA